MRTDTLGDLTHLDVVLLALQLVDHEDACRGERSSQPGISSQDIALLLTSDAAGDEDDRPAEKHGPREDVGAIGERED